LTTTNRMAEIAALMGDPARAAMLNGLLDGRALTAGELGRKAGGDAGAYAAGIGAVAGHCFPAFAHFRGGKGVATSGRRFGSARATGICGTCAAATIIWPAKSPSR